MDHIRGVGLQQGSSSCKHESAQANRCTRACVAARSRPCGDPTCLVVLVDCMDGGHGGAVISRFRPPAACRHSARPAQSHVAQQHGHSAARKKAGAVVPSCRLSRLLHVCGSSSSSSRPRPIWHAIGAEPTQGSLHCTPNHAASISAVCASSRRHRMLGHTAAEDTCTEAARQSAQPSLQLPSPLLNASTGCRRA